MTTSSLVSVVLIMFSLLIVVVYMMMICMRRKPQRRVNMQHPIGGTVFHMLYNLKRLHHYMADIAAKHKTFRMISPDLHAQNIYTTDPAIVEYILKTNFQNYGKGKHVQTWLGDFLGDGIFTVDGDEWREQRKLSSHEFSTKVLRDYSGLTFRKNALKVANIFSQAATNKLPVDINDLFMKATADSIFKIAFGIDLDNLSGSNEDEGVRFSRAFDDSNELTYKRLVDISWKLKKYLNIGSEAKLKKNLKVVDDFVYKVIGIKREQIHKNNNNKSSVPKMMKEDILSRFMHQMESRDPKYFRDIIMSYVLAGKDPIATTMTWFIYMLCKHPQVQDKVAKDIKEATNNNMKLYQDDDDDDDVTKVVEEFEASVTEEALEKMQYLQAALAETIRLYPALPLDPKVCFSDDVLPDGCIVKKGDIISYMPYAMGRMKFIWGDDAQDFKPERWLDQNGCFVSVSPFKFTAFQAGPRTCLGREFAYRQIKIFSSILLSSFMFKLKDKNEDPKYRTTINIQLDGPLDIYVSPRRNAGLHE